MLFSIFLEMDLFYQRNFNFEIKFPLYCIFYIDDRNAFSYPKILSGMYFFMNAKNFFFQIRDYTDMN